MGDACPTIVNLESQTGEEAKVGHPTSGERSISSDGDRDAVLRVGHIYK